MHSLTVRQPAKLVQEDLAQSFYVNFVLLNGKAIFVVSTKENFICEKIIPDRET